MSHSVTDRSQFTPGRKENGRQKVFRKPQIRTRRVQAGRERDAPAQEGNAQVGQRADGEESEAGDRDRAVRGEEKGSQGPAKEDGKQDFQKIDALE